MPNNIKKIEQQDQYDIEAELSSSIFSEKYKTIVRKAELARKEKEEEQARVPIQMQMPFWIDSHRPMPNEIVRSALFNAKNKRNDRAYFREVKINVIGEGTITYTGEELRQYDEIVWLQLLHLTRGKDIDNVITFMPGQFCKAISWPLNSGSYQRLRESLTRMQATSLSIYSKRFKEGVSLSMIPMFKWRDEDGKTLPLYQVKLAPELITLFSANYYTHIEWQQRLQLPVGLSTWLHGYYSSHRTPFPIKIETIYHGCGSTLKPMRMFKLYLKQSLDKLVQIGFLESYEIDETNLVKVTRKRVM